MRHRNASLIAVGALLVAVVPATALATHAGNQPEKFPAYYEGQVRQVMMGPAGNSQKPNQPPFACFGLGPDFSKTNRSADVPLFYTLFVPGATQMGPCPPPTPPGFNNLLHDMVLTAVPGDPGYNAAVQVVRCLPGPNFDPADVPYTSAAEVEAAWAAGELSCAFGRVLAAPVVGGPSH